MHSIFFSCQALVDKEILSLVLMAWQLLDKFSAGFNKAGVLWITERQCRREFNIKKASFFPSVSSFSVAACLPALFRQG